MNPYVRDQLERIKGKPLVGLAREALWRARRDWNKNRILSRVREIPCPATFAHVPYYSPVPEEASEELQQSIVGIANEIIRGRFPFLSYGAVELGFPPGWNVDFVTGLDWPQIASDNPSSIRNDGSDVKVPYELSRLQFLPVLGKAYVLTRREEFRSAARELLADWIRRNPLGIGINWTLAMEAALRGMSICFLLNLMWPIRTDEESWLRMVTQCLWEHVAYIEAHNEFSHLVRSNHYLSNIVGLYCLSLFLEGREIRPKRRTYRRLIEKEILHQVYADGGNYEASLGYHVLVTQMFTSAMLLMRASRIEPEPAFLKRLRLMYCLIKELANSKGWLPHVGDCDDGRVELIADDLAQMRFLPVQERSSLRVSSLLGLGNAIFGGLGGSPDDALWYGFKPGVGPNAALHNAHVFYGSGMAIARSSDASILFFAMPNGIHGIGSHTHNDKLSVIVRIADQELLSDSGTGCYTRDAKARNYYRSTGAHNTVRVDNEEQNTYSLHPRKMFAMSNDAKVSPIELRQSEGIACLRASHTGYSRLGVIHKRTVKCLEIREFVLEDQLSGTGVHHVDINFHLDPAWRVVSISQNDSIIISRIEGPQVVEFTFHAPVSFRAEAETTLIGNVFGSLIPSNKIRLSGKAQLPLCLTTHIRWNQ